MKNYVIFYCIFFILFGSDAADTKDNAPSGPKPNEDNGTALILTPYIEEDRIDDGRKAAEVDPGLFLGFKSYSGFLTVNKTHNSNMYFWYFPVPDKPVNETPWMVWLQGGPGASSLIGLFDEIGPFTVNEEGNLDRNPHTWLRNHSLVFIDNPVGSGYSFTEHEDGLVKDAETYSKHLYSTLRQFLELFPEQRAAPLVIAGESYAGKYVPALAMEVHKHKNLPGGDINLRGLMVGNGYVDTRMLAESARPFYEFGLVDMEQVQFLQPTIDSLRRDIEAGRVTKQGRSKWLQIRRKLTEMSGVPVVYNFLEDHAFVAGLFAKFLLKSEVKRALHVGDIKFTAANITVTAALIGEFMVNPRPWYETLLNHYDIIVLCGQLDLALSCTVASEQYRSWQWDHKDEFLNATRCPLRFEGRVAGYHKTGGRFTEVVVRGAGHMTPKDAPAPMQWLAAQWTHARPLPLSVCRPPRI
ncbi:vitellogenic carboxypeptidase-like [Ostrinia furnacalis]|uniref:vitellogenic carboxypeptidase-like n=1 Tax=Ostrinia furnacalis TaxID=93504 RepID=UPI00103ECF4A|nr:vitellogenic carboxypeptidase-like [Ostrinia furnacalis]